MPTSPHGALPTSPHRAFPIPHTFSDQMLPLRREHSIFCAVSATTVICWAQNAWDWGHQHQAVRWCCAPGVGETSRAQGTLHSLPRRQSSLGGSFNPVHLQGHLSQGLPPGWADACGRELSGLLYVCQWHGERPASWVGVGGEVLTPRGSCEKKPSQPRSGLVSRGSQGLRCPLESRRGSLGSPERPQGSPASSSV